MCSLNLRDIGVDYLLVNTTNRFLLEYAPIEENSCYSLTGFSGDTGDSLICPDGKILLFVDGRYHTQADLEVDKTKVTVYKLVLGEKQDDAICENIKPNSVLGVVAEKVSQKRYEYLKTLLKEINTEIKLLDRDIINFNQIKHSGNISFIDKNLTGTDFSDKINRVEEYALFTNSEEITYLTNLRDFSQEFAVKIDGKLLKIKDKSILFTDYNIEASKDFEVKPLSDFDTIIKTITEPIYIDKNTINAYDYSMVKTPVHRISPVKLMKSVKTKEEINHLKYCFEMTDKALYETRDFIYKNNNLSEYDIDIELTRNFKKYGAKSLSFKSIVARNKNSALAHYMKSSKDEIIKDGDLILIDCGAYYEGGLATDITRVFVKGEPTELYKTVYTTVLKMFLNGFNYQVTEETTGYEIDNFIHQYLEENKIDGFVFSHGLGHGIGICVHEAPPNLSKNEIAKTPLKNNMCFTIEPGLYNENEFGVRLENSCYLENGIIKSFTNMCYEKKLINLSMLSENEIDILNKFNIK